MGLSCLNGWNVPLTSEQGAFELRHNRFKGADHEHSTMVENEHSSIDGNDRQRCGLP